MPYRCYALHVSDLKCVLYYHDWWYKYKIQQKKDKINIYWIQSISMGYKKTRMYYLFHPNFSGTRSRSNGKKSSMWYADSRTAGCWYKENLTPYWLMKSCIQNHCEFFIPKYCRFSGITLFTMTSFQEWKTNISNPFHFYNFINSIYHAM